MALRIRLPPLGAKPSTSSAPSAPEDMEEVVSAKRTRKPPKRYLQDSDNDERTPSEPVHKVRRTSTADRPKPKRRQSVAHSEPSSNPDVENDIDIENDGAEMELEGAIQHQEQEQLDDHRSEHSVQQSTTYSQDRTSSKSKMKAHANVPVARKKMGGRKVVVSDSEEEEEYREPVNEPVPELDDEEDDDYISSDNKHTKSKGKGKATSFKGTKRKAKGDPDDSHIPSLERRGSVKGPAVAKKKLKPSLRLDENIIDVVGDSVDTPEASVTVEHSSPATGKQDSPAPAALPPPLKKPKLPTIKKNKHPGTPSVGTPTSATTTSKKPLLELGLPSKLNHDDVRKTMIGNTDIDLSNKSVYQELFLKTGTGDGNTPRRAKEEERRKELNRMREEAKAKRTAEARHSFDLQAQHDKIQLFEEKLKAVKSSALYPSFLASKCRQVYDKERMRQKAQDMNEQTSQNRKETEEGEVA